MKDYFNYNEGNLPKNSFKISPSQLSKFFDSTSQWYREQVLGETPEFTGSTATYLGNCVHASANMYFDTKAVDHPAIINYVNSINNSDVDKQIILEQYPIMLDTLLANFNPCTATDAEKFISYEILPNIYIGGTADLIDTKRKILYDYKTTGSLDKIRLPNSFPRPYYFQQLSYAYILKKNGIDIDYMKLLYITRANINRISPKTGKPMKDYPSKFHIVTEKITQEKLDFIESVLKLIAESVKTFKEKPELQHIIAQDYRLKRPKYKIFKD